MMNHSRADAHACFDVIVVGAGPVGLTLANLLGQYGVRTLLVERNAALESEPRAVTLDDESLRTFQSAHLVDAVMPDVVPGYGVQYFGYNGKPLAQILPTRQEYGYAKRNAFRQPLLVRALGDGLRRFDNVQAWFGHELVSFEQEGSAVRCHLRHGDSGTVMVTASWLVGCDGGRSGVRELCGTLLDGESYPERWLIVDLSDRNDPLRHTRTYCDPRRPAIRLPGPHGSLRYEFMLRAGDRDEDVLEEATFRSWIATRVPQDAHLPLVRKAIYGFHARVATRWKSGRVLLAGDAAHLTPPFAGQGLNSGIRDAANLAWKLAAVTQWNQAESLLDTYEEERRPHASALIRMALRIGAFMQPKSLVGAALGQTALRAACLIPAVRDYILQLRFKPKPAFQTGFFVPAEGQTSSTLLPQPLVERGDRQIVPFDTVLGDGFAVIGRDSPVFAAAARRFAPEGMPCRAIALLPADHDFLPLPEHGVERVRDLTGALHAFLDGCGGAALVVRPDRYWLRIVTAQELDGRASSCAEPTTPITEPTPRKSIREVLEF